MPRSSPSLLRLQYQLVLYTTSPLFYYTVLCKGTKTSCSPLLMRTPSFALQATTAVTHWPFQKCSSPGPWLLPSASPNTSGQTQPRAGRWLTLHVPSSTCNYPSSWLRVETNYGAMLWSQVLSCKSLFFLNFKSMNPLGQKKVLTYYWGIHTNSG